MNVHDYRFLLSEQTALNKMLAQIPESNVLGRMSLNDRLEQVEEELKTYDGYSPRLVNATLTFSGPPVIGSRGIQADFGLDAAKGFVKLVGLIGANFHGALPQRGRLSNTDDYRLMITGTAVGSYGFQVESASQQPTLEGEVAPVEVAISRVKDIFQASVGTDEQLTHAIDGIDTRALKGMSNFLKTVADNTAVCSLALGGEVFSFRDAGQVRRSQNRLSQDYIREENVTGTGRLLGFFPRRPRAQLEIESVDADLGDREVGRVVTAKVEASLAADTDINGILRRDISFEARVRRVGAGRPTYVITRLHL